MKKLFTLFLSSLIVIPACAQLNGEGYYRIQNAGSGRYMSIVNNKADDANKSAIKGGNDGHVYALSTLKPYSKIVSDPGSIIYIQNNSKGDNFYDLKAQGVYTYSFTGGRSLKIYKSSKSDGSYWLYASESGITKYLFDSDDSGDEGHFTINGRKDSDANEYWYVKPIDQTNEYFGITPEVSANGKFYTTVYASFPFKISSGMKAYYVKQVRANGDESMAELAEIENGIVPIGKKSDGTPIGTPVILECSSQNAADNKVTLLSESETTSTVSGNKLSGVYFSYVSLTLSGKERTNDMGNQLKNVVTYNENTIWVLGTSDGKLALTKATDDQLHVTNVGKYLPANKAYLQLSAPVAEKAGKTIALVDAATYAAGITGITADEQAKKPGVYTLTGIRVSEDSSTEGLPSGVYIVDGQKVIVK